MKYAALYSASADEERGILTLTFMDLDITCTMRLKLATDHKSVTILGLSSKTMGRVGVWVRMTTLSDTTRTVESEQDVREALVDETVTNLVVWNTNSIVFENPLIIDRDIEISGLSNKRVGWTLSKDWTAEGTPAITITNGANVTFKNVAFGREYNRSGMTTIPAYFEVTDSTLRCENGGIGGGNIDALITGENAKIELEKMSLSGAETGIRLDSKAESSSSLKIVDSKFGVDGKLVVSNSANTTVVLPGNFVEFTNAEGQREWTDDASKIPAAE